MIEIPGKGKLDNGGLDRLPYLLARVDEILEQQRRQEGAHENDADAETLDEASQSENGTVRPLTAHDVQRAPAPK